MKLLENHEPDVLRLYIPKNVPEPVLNDRYKKKSKLTYLIHLINILWHTRKGDWVPLYSKYLDDVIGDTYKKYLDYLDENGIIESSDSYSSDRGQSKSYRLSREYRGVPSRKSICKDKHLIKRLCERRRSENRLFYREQPFIHLRESLQVTSIDTLSAKKYLYQEMDGLVQAQVNTFRRSIENIGEGFSTYGKTDKNGRLHTPVVNLSSELRDFLILEGSRKLVEFDITNSQPFFAALLYQQYLSEDNFSRPPFQSNIDSYPKYKPKYITSINNSYFKNSDSWLINPNVPHPRMDFIHDAKNGILYEKIAEMWDRDLTREEAKEKLWPIMYSHPSSHLEKKKKFGQIYPNVLNWMVEQKKPHYRDFPILMQRMESELIIEDLCKRLQEEGIKVLTIHDAIVVKEEKKERVEEIWRSTFRENHGVVPEYTVERLSSEIEVREPAEV